MTTQIIPVNFRVKTNKGDPKTLNTSATEPTPQTVYDIYAMSPLTGNIYVYLGRVAQYTKSDLCTGFRWQIIEGKNTDYLYEWFSTRHEAVMNLLHHGRLSNSPDSL